MREGGGGATIEAAMQWERWWFNNQPGQERWWRNERGGDAATNQHKRGTAQGERRWRDKRGCRLWHRAEEDDEDDDNRGFYYCVGDGHNDDNDGDDSDNGNDGNNGGILKGGYMGYALGEVSKCRTVVVGRQEDAGTDDGKGDRGEGWCCF
jgi:hypothetical protein